MSPEHVSTMNELLAGSAAVKAAASALDREYVLEYQLTGSPSGGITYWSMRFSPSGVAFHLSPAANVDLLFSGDWSVAIAEARASREGRVADSEIPMTGDPAALEAITPVFAAAAAVGTVPVDWPDGA
jgi:hypothetical protein